MLQVLDGLAKERGFELVLAGDSLALNPTFWARMCSLAPKIQTEAAVSDRTISIRQPESTPLNEPTDTLGGESEEGAVLVSGQSSANWFHTRSLSTPDASVEKNGI